MTGFAGVSGGVDLSIYNGDFELDPVPDPSQPCAWQGGSADVTWFFLADSEAGVFQLQPSQAEGVDIGYYGALFDATGIAGPLALDHIGDTSPDVSIPAALTVVPQAWCTPPSAPPAGELTDQAGEVITDQAGAPIQIQG